MLFADWGVDSHAELSPKLRAGRQALVEVLLASMKGFPGRGPVGGGSYRALAMGSSGVFDRNMFCTILCSHVLADPLEGACN